MLYNAVIKRFTALLRFDEVEYYRGGLGALKGLKMAFSAIVAMLYVIDMLYYTVVNNKRELG